MLLVDLPCCLLLAACCWNFNAPVWRRWRHDAYCVWMQVRNEGRQRKRHGKPKGSSKSGAQLKSKSWVLKKKAQMRGKGYTAIPVDTKYTARKRKKGF